MSWSTGPAAKPHTPLAASALQHYGGVDAITQAWREAQDALEKAKQQESQLRAVVFELNFPDAVEGTNTLELGNGYKLKCQLPYYYKLSNKEAATERALDAITEISQQAGFIADRLVKWEPELSVKEYRLLNADNPAAQTPEQKAILAILSPVLTIKPGSPQIEVVPPKGK